MTIDDFMFWFPILAGLWFLVLEPQFKKFWNAGERSEQPERASEPAPTPAVQHVTWLDRLRGVRYRTSEEMMQPQVEVLQQRDWLRLLNDQPDRLAHLFIVGTTGSGKTTFARALLAHRAGEVCILSAKIDDDWGLPFVTYDSDGSCSSLQATIAALLVHLRTRTTSEAPLHVVVDDYPILSAEPELKKPLTELLTRVARVGRSKRMRLVVLAHESTSGAMSTQGQHSVLGNLAWVDVQHLRVTVRHNGAHVLLRTHDLPAIASRAPQQLSPWNPINSSCNTGSLGDNEGATTTTTVAIAAQSAPESEGVAVASGVTGDEQLAIIQAAFDVQREQGRVNRREVCRRVFDGATGGAAYEKVKKVLDRLHLDG
jgi:hypothetical protein